LDSFIPQRQNCFLNITNKLQKKLTTTTDDLYTAPNNFSGDQMKTTEWAGHVACMGERKGPYRILVWKPDGKRPLGISTCRCVDNIKIDLQEVERWDMDWIDMAQARQRWRDRVNAIMILRVS
jgi:hypothetical protein